MNTRRQGWNDASFYIIQIGFYSFKRWTPSTSTTYSTRLGKLSNNLPISKPRGKFYSKFKFHIFFNSKIQFLCPNSIELILQMVSGWRILFQSCSRKFNQSQIRGKFWMVLILDLYPWLVDLARILPQTTDRSIPWFETRPRTQSGCPKRGAS